MFSLFLLFRQRHTLKVEAGAQPTKSTGRCRVSLKVVKLNHTFCVNKNHIKSERRYMVAIMEGNYTFTSISQLSASNMQNHLASVLVITTVMIPTSSTTYQYHYYTIPAQSTSLSQRSIVSPIREILFPFFNFIFLTFCLLLAIGLDEIGGCPVFFTVYMNISMYVQPCTHTRPN